MSRTRGPREENAVSPVLPSGRGPESSKRLGAVGPQAVMVQLRSRAFLLGPGGHRGRLSPSAWLKVRVRPAWGQPLLVVLSGTWHARRASPAAALSEAPQLVGDWAAAPRPTSETRVSRRCSRAVGGLSAP